MTCWIEQRSHRLLCVVATSVLLAVTDGLVDARVGAQAGAAQPSTASSPIVHMTHVTGTVTSVGDDVSGPMEAVGIVSPERRIYLVGDEGMGRQLKGLVGKTVTVAAEVKHDADGWPYLAVEWFRVLEG